MTPGGKCFACGSFTSRHDSQRQRWACRSCWPEPLGYEAELAAIYLRGEFPKLDDPMPQRLPGESRQAWRRRGREGGGTP